jgi:hypothetical protein
MKKLLVIALTLGFLNANSQTVVNPGTEINLGLTDLSNLISRLEVRHTSGGFNVTLAPSSISQLSSSLPSGTYSIDIVYSNNTRRRIEFNTQQ